eukprot:CAMPEP_0119291422 /NCGR_PEP_ID=MMETSP1329-20130426/42435_1 /TAXON_ID=114041 /ORGANISM="Genus nov. species nov., Strain RCC1024" /LENGTH=56 /DNA_ID=CAMNT_0007292249 /DNA_START=12 /DNA_END=179 /DNA_ORIENTATION=-
MESSESDTVAKRDGPAAPRKSWTDDDKPLPELAKNRAKAAKKAQKAQEAPALDYFL